MDDVKKVEATYKVLMPYVIIKAEINSPYKGIKMTYKYDGEEGLFDIDEVDAYMNKKLGSLSRQFANFERHTPIYREAYAHFYDKISSLHERIARTTFDSDRDKFEYHIDKQRQYCNEFYNELRAKIAEINADNEADYLIAPDILLQIYNPEKSRKS